MEDRGNFSTIGQGSSTSYSDERVSTEVVVMEVDGKPVTIEADSPQKRRRISFKGPESKTMMK